MSCRTSDLGSQLGLCTIPAGIEGSGEPWDEAARRNSEGREALLRSLSLRFDVAWSVRSLRKRHLGSGWSFLGIGYGGADYMTLILQLVSAH